jgi:hypothetical protein
MSQQGWFSGPSQVSWTCKALIDGRSINHRMEIREVRGWRLGAIIHRLRKHYGWPVETEYRGPDRIAHYSLPPGTDPANLRFPRSARGLDPKGDAA